MRGELQGAFVTIPRNASGGVMTGSERALRREAVTEARIRLSSEGYTPSKQSEDLARRFVAGEIDQIKFSGYRHDDPTQDHA